MDVAAITQLVTLLGVGMALIWHQQHSTTQIRKENRADNQKFRDDFNTANQKFRDDFNTANQKFRDDFNTANQALRDETRADNQALRDETRADNQALREAHNKLRDAIAQNGQRLARIEGRLEIAVPLAGDDPKETATG